MVGSAEGVCHLGTYIFYEFFLFFTPRNRFKTFDVCMGYCEEAVKSTTDDRGGDDDDDADTCVTFEIGATQLPKKAKLLNGEALWLIHFTG